MSNIKRSETFLLKVSNMNDRDAFIEALRMMGLLMDRVNTLEKELKAHKNGGYHIHGDPEQEMEDLRIMNADIEAGIIKPGEFELGEY